MTDWRTLVRNSDTLSATDLDGKDVTVKIESVIGGEFESGDEDGGGKVDRVALIAFVGKKKKMAANTINCTLLEAMWGPDVEGWVGHVVTVGPDKVEVRGKFFGQPCLRIKGSPELSGPKTVQIALPRRRPIERKLRKTEAPGLTQQPAPVADAYEREHGFPQGVFDEDTGGVGGGFDDIEG